ncbi:hypothetical protein BKA69DRAFT_443944 [Paraphysoderma sedebokerense]|nr:hypothetical protein BKA69DRAFT_443944 [Paraphysoderma sedebokerense]
MKTVPMIAADTLKPINVDMKMDLSSLSLKDSNSESDENVEQSSPTDIQLDTIQDVVIMADKPEFENGNSYFYMADALDEDESITHDIDEETESDFLDPVDMETVVITDAEDTNTRPWDISSSALGSEEKIWNANNLFRPTDQPSKTDSSLELFQSLSKGDFQSGARELIEKIFEIGTIRLDEKMVDFFKMDETMSIFMSYLSRVPDRKNPYHPPPDGEIDASVVRERDRDLKATKYSFRVMEILCCNAPTNSSVVHVKLSIIIKSLFDVFSPTSDGNFHHFRQVFESLLPRHPGPILRMIMNGDNEDDGISKPLLFRMLFYLHEYPVTVSLLTVLFGVSNPKEKARRFARLQSMEFLETILSRLDCKVPQIVEACQDFVVRLVDEALKVEQSDLLFKSLEGDRTIIDRIVKTISTGEPYQQEAGIAILHALAVRSNIRPPLSAAARNFFLPQKDTTELVNTATGVKKYLLNHLPFISSQLVPNNTQESDEISEEEGGLKLSSYQVPQPFTHHRLALLEIIHDLLSESVTDSSILDDVSPLFWKQLVNWFFQYKYNSLYQTRFYKIFLQLLRANHSPTFKVIFSKSKFIARMIDHYNEQGGHSDLRGYIILICNTIRLTAEGQSPSEYFHNMLKTHAKWKEFQPILL